MIHMIPTTLNIAYYIHMISSRSISHNHHCRNHSLYCIFLGDLVACLSLENDIDSEHENVKGHINYSELCWWKEINDDNENLIYFSTKACTYKHNLHFRKRVSICKTMKTIEWKCMYCSLHTTS